MSLTPRRVLERREVIDTYAAWREHQTQGNGAIGPAAPELWLEKLRNAPPPGGPIRPSPPPASCPVKGRCCLRPFAITQPACSTDAVRSAQRDHRGLLAMPFELLSMIVEWLDMRSLAYGLSSTCRKLRLVSRQPRHWNVFRLQRLVTANLPVVSRFAQLRSLYPNEKAHREHFWLRFLGAGYWPPNSPTELDFSCSTSPLSLRDVASIVSRGLSSVKKVNLSMCVGLTDDVLSLFFNHGDESRPAVEYRLVELDISCNSAISPETILAFLSSSACHESLASLDISDCSQLTEVLDFWDRFLRSPPRSLRTLKARGIFPSLPAALFPTLLQVVDLSYSTGVSTSTVRQLLQQCSMVRVLSLCGCKDVSDAAFEDAADADDQLSCRHLTTVNLDQCQRISDTAVTQLWAITKGGLQHLSLEQCSGISGRFVWRFFPAETASDTLHSGREANSAERSCALKLEVTGCNELIRCCLRDSRLRQALCTVRNLFTPKSQAFFSSHRIGLSLPTKRATPS